MKTFILLAVLLITACDSLYYKDIDHTKKVVIKTFADSQELWDECDLGHVEACSYSTADTCYMFLPERYSPGLYAYELRRCYGGAVSHFRDY